MIVGPDGKLAGTVTDGDIRRGLLRAMPLTSPIQDIIQREPLIVTPQMGRDLVLNLMSSHKISRVAGGG